MNDKNEQPPKTANPQDPTDIGDQYLNMGACSARDQPARVMGKPSLNAALAISDLTIMCQKRSGRLRSTISRTPQMMTSGNAIQYAIVASGRSSSEPNHSI